MPTNKIFFSILLILCACQHPAKRQLASDPDPDTKNEQISKKAIKDYFKKMPDADRLKAIENARVTVTGYDPAAVPTIDLVAELEKTCGERFRYQKTNVSLNENEYSNFGTFESYQWPKVECRYKPDDGDMGGYSKKFLCEFENSKSKDGFKTIKVRYPKSRHQPLRSEVFDTLLATQMTKLVGFYAESYCPAEVSCRNCPSDNPWDNNRAGAPGSNDTYDFPWTILEHPLPFQSMASRPPSEQRNQGLDWSELKFVQKDNPSKARQMKIEREAWMLWLNFLQHLDAGYFNQRLSCAKITTGADGKPFCADPVLYTHDFGHTFLWSFDLSNWLKMPTLKSGSAGETCRGTMQRKNNNADNPVFGEIFEPAISAEARDLLVDRLSRITNQQWLTIYQLSRIEEVTRINSSTWLKGVKNKIQQMKSVECLPFDSNRSVLAVPN